MGERRKKKWARSIEGEEDTAWDTMRNKWFGGIWEQAKRYMSKLNAFCSRNLTDSWVKKKNKKAHETIALGLTAPQSTNISRWRHLAQRVRWAYTRKLVFMATEQPWKFPPFWWPDTATQPHTPYIVLACLLRKQQFRVLTWHMESSTAKPTRQAFQK